MALMNVEAATFLVGEEGFDMCSLLVHLHSGIQIGQSCDQIERSTVRLFPQCQNAERAIVRRSHKGAFDREQFTARRPEIADVEAHTTSTHQDVCSSTADVVPACTREVGLQCRAIKLPITQEGYLCTLWHQCLDLGQQFLMQCFGKMPFGTTYNYPAEWHRATVVDNPHHQDDTAPPDHTAIHHHFERLLSQVVQQLAGNR